MKSAFCAFFNLIPCIMDFNDVVNRCLQDGKAACTHWVIARNAQDFDEKRGSEMFDVHDCIAFLTNNGAKAVGEAMNNQFKKQDLTRTQWTALYFIDQHHKISQKNLAHTMVISEPSVVHLIERLENHGLVTRTGDPENFRSKLISLTEKGKAALDALFPIVEAFNKDGTKDISPEDLDVFKRVMAQIIHNVERISDCES